MNLYQVAMAQSIQTEFSRKYHCQQQQQQLHVFFTTDRDQELSVVSDHTLNSTIQFPREDDVQFD